MTFKTDILAGFAKIKALMPVAVVIGTNSYTGVRSVLSQQRLFSPEGYGPNYDFTVRISEDDLTANGDNPEPQDKVTIDSVVYRVLDSRVDNVGAMRRLDLMAEYS